MIGNMRVNRIFVAEHAVDFRCQHDGLLAQAYRMKLDPFQGDMVVFIGRRKNRIKVLYADQTGLWVAFKRFTMEAMKTHFRFLTEPSCRSITHTELNLLLEGACYTIQKQVRPYTPGSASLQLETMIQAHP
jgi:transposase